MTERKSLTKKIRFEVFKRDNFKCQYCGCSAPDKVLEVDHMIPISKNGTNDMLNLVTSCFDCNRGKSNNLISDNSVLEKQRHQIEQLNLRRQQLEMLMEWKLGMKNIDDEALNKCDDYIGSLTGYNLSKPALITLSKLIKRFGIENIIEAIEISYNRYYLSNNEDFELFFNKISGICITKSLPDHIRKINYAKGILRNRVYCNDKIATELMNDYYNQGYDLEELIDKCKSVKTWCEFKNWIK